MKKGLNWRIFISFGLLTSFLMLLISGIILYIAPPGRVANWTGWNILGLSKHAWQNQHTIFGFSFALLSIFHLFVINWKAFFAYITTKTAKGLKNPVEFSAIILLTLLFGIGTQLEIQPFTSIINFGESIKDSWEEEANEPPVPHAETMTLEELSRQPALDQTAETMLETLQKAGLKATATTQTLGDIAKDNNMLPTEVYKLLAPAAKKGTGQGQQQGQQKKELQKEGFGRKTLEQVAEENGVTSISLQLALKQQNIAAEPGMSMRAITEKNNIAMPTLRQKINTALAR
ncbi:DUF4405 domain-containing protein [Chlorobium phaeovibrioides]|uniref:DUF4405 domain-containing protein n=1 Tax=Chlorobium phaeovibrioides TaxID=1094 RepID=A0A432AWP5_CHLPH|nr:DUF4405 domain-containing protein [Chlorobium phaeovibrioides]KAA6230649.1 DUF4405 domain-containing protein [Chlorobium phaeovibrioides]MWV54369.1 DUF4405 domain-containing protein [Chlorobium phaeovibrioides]QEQ56487.1 DUF4405 domain-containing protein [Chlorobium phaeovibrioides]RTY35762.1 DUF4405 domain-containing protein [Chlorobium phaeovibrioides]RTY39076.1 DUF4405 domain-containing protein [Chlorobium phaeovibrioides]